MSRLGEKFTPLARKRDWACVARINSLECAGQAALWPAPAGLKRMWDRILWIIQLMTSLSETWGTQPEERRLSYPCDRAITQPDAALFRGVTINASAKTVFRWLCQMRIAPYSYDWIDNGGKQSPQELTPGLDHLVIGQDVMTIFDLIDFETNRHLTLRIKPRSSGAKTFGDIAVSYLIVEESPRSCRLLVKLIANYPRNVKGSVMKLLLPWGDLIMMRRQLLNLKQLAEQTVR